MMKNKWSKISLFFLFIVALIGTYLRASAYISVPLLYANLVHAHSHVAFQGWVYTIMFQVLSNIFLTETQIKKGLYPLQFKITIMVLIGVMVSFSLQGYGLYSIIFSTIFQLLNYWFIYRFLKDTKEAKKSISLRFIKTGLYLGLLSTLLPYFIGITSAKGLAGTEIYRSLVYTFLHFQYNGWFLFVVLGLFFNFLEKTEIRYSQQYAANFYWLFTVAVIPAVGLSLVGMSFAENIIWIAYFAAIFQWVGLIYFLLLIKGNITSILSIKSKWFNLYFFIFIASFILKITTQSLSVFPAFQNLAFFNKQVILAYLHLSLIGGISFLFLALLIEMKWLLLTGMSKAGTVFLIAGFLVTELLLTAEGLGLYHHQIALIIGSVFMVVGILLLMLCSTQTSKL